MILRKGQEVFNIGWDVKETTLKERLIPQFWSCDRKFHFWSFLTVKGQETISIFRMSKSMNFILTRTVVISWTTPSFVSHPSVSILAEPCRITFLNIVLYCNVQLNKCYFHRKTFSKIFKILYLGMEVPKFRFWRNFTLLHVSGSLRVREQNELSRTVEWFVDSWIGIGNSGSLSSKNGFFEMIDFLK